MVAEIANGAKEGPEADSTQDTRHDRGEMHSTSKSSPLSKAIQSNTIIDQIHDAVIVTDLENIIVGWNKGAEIQLGYSEKEIIGQPIYTLYPEERQKYLSAHVLKIFKKKGSFELELSMRRKSGELFFAHSSLSPIKDNNGNIIGIISYSLDITERKQAEIELSKYRDRLEELVEERTSELKLARENLLKSNLSLKALSHGNYALVHATDEQQLLDDICRIIVDVGNYKLAWVGYAVHDENKSIQPVAQYGYEKDYIDALNITWADTENGRGPAGITLRTACHTLVSDIMTDPDFKPWRDEAKKRGYGSVAGFPLLEKNNQAFGALMIYSSVANSFKDEEIELLTELANNMTYGILALRTRKELINKERLAVLGQLIATVSHELRNPLGTIRTSLYTVSQKLTGKNKDILGKQLNRAERNVARCDTIIGELLDFTRAPELHPEMTSLDELCKEVLNDYVFPDAITVTKKISSNAKINIEKEKIRRCLINILNNACQALLQLDGIEINNTLTLEVLTNSSSEKAWVEIRDTGPGIADTELNKIFEPLYSTKTYGIGLGLSIVKQLMEQHSGGISISSQANEGTSVILWFPV